MMRNITLNKIRITCSDSDRDSLHIKSTLDNTAKLSFKCDEDISFTDEDLIAIKNCKDSACNLTVKAIRLPDGRQAVFSPSRQSHFKILDSEVSQIRSEHSFTLGPGETCMLRSTLWVGRGGAGAVFPV